MPWPANCRSLRIGGRRRNDDFETAGALALSRELPDGFIDRDADEDHRPDDRELQLRGDAEHVDRVVEDAHERRSDDHAEDRSFPAAQRAPAQNRRRDGVELVEIPEAGW